MSVASAQAEAFYTEVLTAGGVWAIGDDAGCPAPMTPDGYRAMPFWSSRTRAERIVSGVEAYSGMQAFEIPISDWRQRWLPGLDKDGIHVGLNWAGKRAVGFDISVADLVRNFILREERCLE